MPTWCTNRPAAWQRRRTRRATAWSSRPASTGASSYYQLTRVSENGDVTDTRDASRLHEAARGGLRQDRLHVRVRRHIQLRRRHRQLGHVRPRRVKPGSGGYSDAEVAALRPHAHHRAGMVRQLADGEVHERRMRRRLTGQALLRACQRRTEPTTTASGWRPKAQNDTVVTYSNIDYTPIGGEAVNCCRVKVWKTK